MPTEARLGGDGGANVRALVDRGRIAIAAAGVGLARASFELARDYRTRGMSAYSDLQQAEFVSEEHGYTATRHQREVGTGYFDAVSNTIAGGESSTTALTGSTEEAQFESKKAV